MNSFFLLPFLLPLKQALKQSISLLCNNSGTNISPSESFILLHRDTYVKHHYVLLVACYDV